MEFAQILSRFSDVSEDHDGYLALCPAHNDFTPSLKIFYGEDGKVRFTCRAGCANDDIRRAVGLAWPDLFNATGAGLTISSTPPAPVGPSLTAPLAMWVDTLHDALVSTGAEAAWSYAHRRFGVDANTSSSALLGYSDGSVPFQYASRAFTAYPRLVVPFMSFTGVIHAVQGRDISGDCPGRWVGLANPEGAVWGKYGLFKGAGGYDVVLITEGPGDALTGLAVGYDTLCIRGAAFGSIPSLVDEIASGLKATGKRVILAGDNDDSGRRFNRTLAKGLQRHGISVYTLDIPDCGPKTDLTKWREEDPHHFPRALHDAVRQAAPYSETDSLLVDAATGSLIPNADTASRAIELVTEYATKYKDSDVLCAHALVAFTGRTIRYAEGLGFLVWDGSTWKVSDTKVRQQVHLMGSSLSVAAASLQGDEKKYTEKLAKRFMNRTSIENILTELKSVPAVYAEADDFDSRPELLSFKNGTVDLRTGELRPHSMGDMLTTRIDADFDPSAQAPRWESFIKEIMPDLPDMPGYLQRLVGYGITGSTSEQCFAVLHGKGANGKSVFTETLTDVFGSITTTTPFSTFEDKGSGGIPNDIAALKGSRLVMASEGDSGRPMSEAVLKRVTGKDRVTARFMRREFFTFQPTFLIMLATNHKPNFRGQDEGLWRRVKMIPFNRFFAPHERDYGLQDKLMSETPGIIAWAVRGAIEWYANGLQDPETVREATKEFRETSDALQGFMPGVIDLTHDEGDRIQGNECFSLYLEWAEAENLPQKERWKRTTFYRAMEERGVVRKKTAQGITLFGIRKTEEADMSGPEIFTKD